MRPSTSNDYANWAKSALIEYAVLTEGAYERYGSDQILITEFLSALMHYAVREGIDMPACLNAANEHHEAQCEYQAQHPAD